MKKSIIALFAVVALSGSAFAGATVASSGKEYKEYKTVEPFTCFNDRELQIDAFGSYTNTQGGGAGDGWGGGLALNYYFHRYIGAGLDGDLHNGGNQGGVWNGSGRILLRYPIDSMCLAPYAFFGAGYQGGHGAFTAHAGAGLEYRIVPHKVGLFSEARYSYAGDNNDNWQFRAGVRFVF